MFSLEIRHQSLIRLNAVFVDVINHICAGALVAMCFHELQVFLRPESFLEPT
ncbi:hypothetical protein BDZ89DRAFT_1057461 [Hymenopellis radicata]|nr:hypothetical protein BDZ89DRAFT_1057461 [Hymenopellis radicata]